MTAVPNAGRVPLLLEIAVQRTNTSPKWLGKMMMVLLSPKFIVKFRKYMPLWHFYGLDS